MWVSNIEKSKLGEIKRKMPHMRYFSLKNDIFQLPSLYMLLFCKFEREYNNSSQK